MEPSLHRVRLPRPTGVAAAPAALGTLGERLAATHLVEAHGLRLLARNWRLTSGQLRGELDVVALDAETGTLVVCEVKTRRDAARFGGAVSALSARQLRRLRVLTAAFLRESAPSVGTVRLDLVALDVSRRVTLTHVEAIG